MEIKGTAVLAIRDYVKNNHSTAYNDWLNTLKPETKHIFENAIDSTQWFPVEVAGVEPTRQIANVFYNKDLKKGAWDSGRFSAQKALTGIYKIFVKASSPNFIISRARDIFSRYYRPCTIRVVENTAKSVTLHFTSMDGDIALIEYRIAGWIERALEINGCKNVQLLIPRSMSRGDELTEFEITWE